MLQRIRTIRSVPTSRDSLPERPSRTFISSAFDRHRHSTGRLELEQHAIEHARPDGRSAVCDLGAGTRLWPLSRELYPKQLLPLVSDQTMLQETVARVDGLGDVGNPLVVCNETHSGVDWNLMAMFSWT